MKISYVSIKNFRGLKDVTLNPSQMNCVIGENNSGKSTVLLAINLFLKGTKISESDYYDSSQEVYIDISFGDVSSIDLDKIADDENKLRIEKIIENNTLIFRRKYGLDFTSELLC